MHDSNISTFLESCCRWPYSRVLHFPIQLAPLHRVHEHGVGDAAMLGGYYRLWLVRIQRRRYSLLTPNSRRLTIAPPTAWPTPSALQRHVCGFAIGSSFTHALLSVFTSSRVPVHNSTPSFYVCFVLHKPRGVRGRVRLFPGRVCEWGSRDDYQCVGRARSVHARHVEGACRWEMGRRLVTGGWRRRGKKWWTNSSTAYVLIIYPRSKLTFGSRSTCTILPTPRPPPRNDTGLVGKAQRKEKDKLAWKLERRYDVAFLSW